MHYSLIDFNLNDPTTADLRPVKYHSKIKNDIARQEEVKKISRYFRIKDSHDITSDILVEGGLSLK